MHCGVRTAEREAPVIRRDLESPAGEGESPVRENRSGTGSIRSTVRHVEAGRKKGGPPPKAKYYSVTASESTVKER